MDEITLRTQVRQTLLRKALLRGTLLGAVGVALLLFATFYHPSHTIRWGVAFVLVFILLVSMGLIPYRRLARLQTHPDELHLGVGSFTYIHRQTPFVTLSVEAVKDVRWIEVGELYGIGIDIDEIPGPAQPFATLSRRRAGCDLFFAYFSETSFREFKEYLDKS